MVKLNHPIFESFLRDLEHHKKDDAPTSAQRYHIDCWKSCKLIYTAIKKLEIAEKCIRQSCNYSPNEYEDAEYVEFHIENYLIRSCSVYDRVLIFVNYLCDIQMSKEFVVHNPIITNQKVIDTGLVNRIKKLTKACKSYQTERNAIVHYGKYEDDALEWVKTAKRAKKVINGDIKSIGLSDEIILKNTIEIMTKKAVEFRENSEKIKVLVTEFMDDAKNIYDSRSTKT